MLSNPLACSLLRSVLLMLLVICAGGVIFMENPANSLIAMHPRFCWMVKLLQSDNIPAICLTLGHETKVIDPIVFGISMALTCMYMIYHFRTQVFKCAFWMRKHLAMTWKRTWVWSTSKRIRELDLGPMTAEEKVTTVKTTKRWKKMVRPNGKEQLPWKEHSESVRN